MIFPIVIVAYSILTLWSIARPETLIVTHIVKHFSVFSLPYFLEIYFNIIFPSTLIYIYSSDHYRFSIS